MLREKQDGEKEVENKQNKSVVAVVMLPPPPLPLYVTEQREIKKNGNVEQNMKKSSEVSRAVAATAVATRQKKGKPKR